MDKKIVDNAKEITVANCLEIIKRVGKGTANTDEIAIFPDVIQALNKVFTTESYLEITRINKEKKLEIEKIRAGK